MAVLEGSVSGNLAEVDTANQLFVKPSNTPANTGTIRAAFVSDAGTATGNVVLTNPEANLDYQVRTAIDTLLDMERFNYTAQNTGKHTLATTTMTAGFTTGAFQTNASGITTVTTGLTFGTYAQFPLLGTSTLYCETTAAFNTLCPTNTSVDFGLFQRSAGTPYAPTEGAYFRFTSAGVRGVVCSLNTELPSDLFNFNYDANRRYQFVIEITGRIVRFWIDNVLYATVIAPDSQTNVFMGSTLPWSIRHSIAGGAASAVFQCSVGSYSVYASGVGADVSMMFIGNRVHGSYQGYSGGTMGSLAAYTNNANPTAAVPTNTTAALGTGLGGQFWETDTLAVNTDGIICSYSVPVITAATIPVIGRRLRIHGVKIKSFVQTALTGGGYNAVWTINFGQTLLSLATTEGVAQKAPRRKVLGSYSVRAGETALAEFAEIERRWDCPIYVNPGELVSIAKKKVGTAPTAGTIAHLIDFDCSWE